ncbi:uncharacterized protein LOC142318095 [Lycorma delicatula]|uniref:uncharacterized protein LOC142318095 n=1 Tax=Lycorma delicatula TaxID=130591 RepID=UPI003F510080
MINHFAGLIYFRFTNRLKEAIQFIEKAYNRGMLTAGIDFVKLKYLENPKEYNPLPDLENIVQKFLQQDSYYSAIAHIASYYFFNLNDTIKAWKYVKKIITDKPDHYSLKMMNLPSIKTIKKVKTEIGHTTHYLQHRFLEFSFYI